jgi:hypothetical protein
MFVYMHVCLLHACLPAIVAAAFVLVTAANGGAATANANTDADDARSDADVSVWCYLMMLRILLQICKR